MESSFRMDNGSFDRAVAALSLKISFDLGKKCNLDPVTKRQAVRLRMQDQAVSHAPKSDKWGGLRKEGFRVNPNVHPQKDIFSLRCVV